MGRRRKFHHRRHDWSVNSFNEIFTLKSNDQLFQGPETFFYFTKNGSDAEIECDITQGGVRLNLLTKVTLKMMQKASFYSVPVRPLKGSFKESKKDLKWHFYSARVSSGQIWQEVGACKSIKAG